MAWTLASCDSMSCGVGWLGLGLLPFWPFGLQTASSFDARFGPT